MNKIIIGLVGPIASGKGILSEYLSQQGFIVEKLSDRIREETAKRGLEVNRKHLQDVGNDLRKVYGSQILAELTLKKNSENIYPICIDGVRNPGEVDFIKKNGGMVIGINAPKELRLVWYLERAGKREEDGASVESFNIANDRDLGLGEASNGQQVGECLKMSDYVIENIGTPEELIETLREVMTISLHLDFEGRHMTSKEIY